jgi:hypothetical protein
MPVVATCRECFVRDLCGGWTAPGEGEPLLTCFEAFGHAKGLFIDPNNRTDFLQRLKEVRFFDPAHPQPFVPAALAEFPEYLPLLQGGICFRRPLKLDFAALNFVEIFHGDKARGLPFGERELTRESLRAEWGLRPDAKVLLSGVADDPELERLAGNYRAKELARKVALFGVNAVTAPNFTFWRNAPRLESLVNRMRMFRVAEELTAHGVAVIPHLNSTNSRDWDWMLAFYREHPEQAAVCMEFRTGNRIREVRQRKVSALEKMRDILGRELHPVIVGNIEAAREMRVHFPRVTAIDSVAALKTIRRQEAIARVGIGLAWRKQPIASGACMADLYERNHDLHLARVKTRFSQPMETPAGGETTAKPHRPLLAASQLLQGELSLEAA